MEGGMLGRMRKGAAALSEIYDASSVRQEKQTRFKQIRQLSENRALQNLMFDGCFFRLTNLNAATNGAIP